MLPKLNRLKKNKDIKRVLEKGKGFKEGFLILRLLPNKLGKIRFTFIVSQKVSPKATLRNKIKRRLRELIRLKIEKTKPARLISQGKAGGKGIDAIIIAVPGLENKDFWEIDKTINKLLKRAKIIEE